MAKIYGEIASSALMTFDKSFSRSNGQPLDSTEVFYSLVEAQNYAKTDVAYVGQKIVVIETVENETKITHYSIEADNSLKELGSAPQGDGSTIEIVNGKIQLKGVEDADVGAQPRIKDDGSIEWVVPSTETVEGLQTTVAGLQSDVNTFRNKLGSIPEGKSVIDLIEEAKTEATYDDTTIIGRIKFIEDDYLKTSDRNQLELSISNAEDNAVRRVLGYLADEEVNVNFDTLKEVAAWIESDTTASAELITRVSNIEKDYLRGTDKTVLQNAIKDLETFIGTIPEGSVSTNVIAYIHEVVDGLKIGDYAKASELNSLADRVTIIEEKLRTITTDAEENFIKSVDEEQFVVDEESKLVLLDIAMSKVTGLEDALDSKVDRIEGKSLIDDTLISKLENLEEGSQVNKLEEIKVAGNLLNIVDKTVDIPVATTEEFGVVKSSDSENKVSVLEDGTMEVNSVNIKKVVQDSDDVLILNGGNSAD